MKFAIAALVLAAMIPTAAPAADYSQDGIYVLQTTPPKTADDQAKLQLKCALSFYDNGKNGNFAQYFLDRNKFKKDGTVSYLEANAGACQMDDKTKLESCQSKYAVDGKIADEPASFNFYKELSADRFVAYSFGSADDFTKWKAAGSKDEQSLWTQVRCKDLSVDLVTSHLSQDINPLNQADTSANIFDTAEPKAEDYALAKKVMKALKK